MPFDVTLKAALQFWEYLDCPMSVSLAIKARHGMWAEVLATKADPVHFADPIQYAKANAAVSFLKKNPDVPGASPEERRQRALQTWRAGEASCYHTNQRLARFLVSPLSGDPQTRFLNRVRDRLLAWLGDAPCDDELKRLARHGPGSTFSSSVPNPTAADKYSDDLTLTSGAVFHLLNIAGTKWTSVLMERHTGDPLKALEFLPGNRYASVPKTALTDRSIGIEPTLNVYFQLAVGSSIRSRLRRRAGWDLDNAATIHREVARQASVDGSFATLDLSNASDTLSRNLVKVLLRDTRWLHLLEELRSPKTRVDGKWHVLEKFSSMGNGYTFELESCIFAAICAECLVLRGHMAVFGEDLFVFGDDIIVPSDAADLVIATLAWLGFQTNKEKSFTQGPFRESCGGDFYNGVPVRGFYLKESLTPLNHRTTFTLHNGVKRLEREWGLNTSFCDWMRAVLLPSSLRHLGGAERLGDTVLHGVKPKYRWKDHIRWVKAVRWSEPVITKWAYFSEEARLACRLTGYGDTFGISSRGLRQCLEVVEVTDS